jgi:hypothetical protein
MQSFLRLQQEKLNISHNSKGCTATYTHQLTKGNTMLNIPYVQDPSHGWAIVKRDLLPKIRLKEEDFPYSYLSPKENFIALEEDCEMPILLKALDAHQIEYNIIDRIVEDEDPDNPRNW